ncbi:hypothetical protein N7495_008553 [Penicillium taxi]|uniref:uncharacterized protein n=1 Tax=Penicillium taxi TaxID=168475 RepID=UPI0025458311|nr:uncharacterized protein N7495_008553 [Penicillium taxi]KAJ5888512.1 hypothetical protein N7495_008553 [Penicillium taxi]
MKFYADAIAEAVVDVPKPQNATGLSNDNAKKRTRTNEKERERLSLYKMTQQLDESSSYFQKCKKLCDDPKKLQQHIPEPEAVRRMRSWAGAHLPEDLEKQLPRRIPNYPNSRRPFSALRKELTPQD